MQPSSLSIIKLSNYETIDEILSETEIFSKDTAKPSGIAVLFSNEPENKNQVALDLFSMASKELRNKVKSHDSITNFRPNGDIDDDLKSFIYKLMMANESLINCASIQRDNLKSFHDFDRIELKMIFQNLANML
ncbi:hypothetical protein LMH73_027085 [Vibrio splendidus]|nr:hypothetical protein [Vibrio splendidus]MCC4880849.1 hypothetical protein [Vibrio splendidus]